MRLKLGLVLLATAVFLVAALWGIDLGEARAALARTRWLAFVPMVLLYLLAHVLRAWRLGRLVGVPVPYGRLFAINTIGFLAINVVPLRLGEMVRPYLLAEREGVPFGRGLAAIFIERMLDFGALLVILGGLTWVVELPAEGIVVHGVDVIGAGQRLAGVVLAAGVAGGAALVLGGEPVLRLVRRLPLGERVAGLAERFREGLVGLLRRPATALGCALATAGIWGLTIGAVQVVLAAFPGVPATWQAAWTTWGITLSGMTAVPTPGFFGAYELFCTAALWLFGVDGSIARTFAVVLHLGQFGFTVGIGAIFMVLEGVSLRTLVERPPGAPGA